MEYLFGMASYATAFLVRSWDIFGLVFCMAALSINKLRLVVLNDNSIKLLITALIHFHFNTQFTKSN